KREDDEPEAGQREERPAVARHAERDREARGAEEAVDRAEPSPDDHREEEEENEKTEELEVERRDAHRRGVPNGPVDVPARPGDELPHARDGGAGAVPETAEGACPGEVPRPGRVELRVQERERLAALLPEHERVDDEAERREGEARQRPAPFA